MKQKDPTTPPEREEAAVPDLVERLERYRKRVRSEGRPHAVTKIDQAIAEASEVAKGRR